MRERFKGILGLENIPMLFLDKDTLYCPEYLLYEVDGQDEEIDWSALQVEVHLDKKVDPIVVLYVDHNEAWSINEDLTKEQLKHIYNLVLKEMEKINEEGELI